MLDFSKQVLRLIEDITQKVPVFSHVDPERILISCADVKKAGTSGVWAQLYPMKYENGHYSIRERSGKKIYIYKTDQIRIGKREIHYIMYFMMPRFQNLSYFEKLETIFHELYHISPEFDGRLRLVHPRFNFHGSSMRLYDQKIRYWVRYYLNANPELRSQEFLKYDFRALSHHHEGVDLVYVPEPRETLKIMVSQKRRRALRSRLKKRGRKGPGRA